MSVAKFYWFLYSCNALTIAIICLGGNASKQDKDKLNKNIEKAVGVVGRLQENTDTV